MWKALLLLPLFGLAIEAGDVSKDQEMFQGKWSFLVVEERGTKLSQEVVNTLEVVVKDDSLTVTEKDKVIAEFKFKIDARTRPRAIDFTHTSGKDKGLTELGIYQFERDTVKICMDEEGKNRPAEFVSRENTALSLVVLKKKK